MNGGNDGAAEATVYEAISDENAAEATLTSPTTAITSLTQTHFPTSRPRSCLRDVVCKHLELRLVHHVPSVTCTSPS